MRIVDDTPSHLKLRDRTLWISGVCFGAAAIAVLYELGQGETVQLGSAAVTVAFGLAFLRATDVTFDKIGRTCIIRRLDVLRVRRTRVAFTDITDVRVEPSPAGDESGTISCRLSLVTSTADFPLSAVYEPDHERYERMRDAVLDVLFAHRPVLVDPVHVLIKSGRIIDAVAFLRTRDGLDLTTARARVEELQRDVGT